MAQPGGTKMHSLCRRTWIVTGWTSRVDRDRRGWTLGTSLSGTLPTWLLVATYQNIIIGVESRSGSSSSSSSGSYCVCSCVGLWDLIAGGRGALRDFGRCQHLEGSSTT